jgi:septal ring factor EnvC (AmiA/AmiB activator)
MEARPPENTDANTSSSPPNAALDTRADFFQSHPAITHFTVLALFLTPLAAVPYLLSKRRFSVLSRRLDEVSTTTTALRKELKTSVTENAARRVELHRTSASLEAARSELIQLRRSLKQLRTECDASDITTRNALKQLLEERKLTSEHLALFPQLGTSLADVAAFMYEVELHHGITSSVIDGHGVERLRRLALKFQIAQSERPR